MNSAKKRRSEGLRSILGKGLLESVLLVLVALALANGCASPSRSQASSGVFKGSDLKPSQVQAQLMALSDELIARISETAEDIERDAEELETRRLAHTLKLVTAEAAIANVSVPNPLIGLLDMVVMTTLMRSRVEVIAPRMMRKHGEMMVGAFARAEQNAWALAQRLLTEEQIEALRGAIETWSIENRDLRYVARIRLSEFANERLETTSESQDRAALPSNLLGLVLLDPLSGLDPAVREIEQARLLAERVAYQAQRMPRLLRWEAEALYYDMITNPEVAKMVASFNTASTGIGRVGALAERFPEVIRKERTAAVDQLARSMTREARTLVSDIEGAGEPVRRTLEQYTEAATATTEAARAVDELTVKSKTLAEQLGLGQDRETSGDGVKLEEVESTAETVEDTAHELGEMLSEANALASQPALSSPEYVAQMTERSSDELLDEILEVGVVLVLVAAASLFLAIVGALWLSSKFAHDRAVHEHFAWRR